MFEIVQPVGDGARTHVRDQRRNLRANRPRLGVALRQEDNPQNRHPDRMYFYHYRILAHRPSPVLTGDDGLIVIVFLICSRPRRMYKEIGKSQENFLIGAARYTSTGGLSDCGGSAKHRQPSLAGPTTSSTASLPCERPPGMTGIIARNSYKNRHGNWHQRDANALVDGQYSSSFSSLEPGKYRYDSLA
ncbi:unnamed protein product [Nesidiocoris tenuis]|uniref:Uncharacterized protein n=1 Tax=Nesidiocoris tenuis TaxID=355587 RepID=A0A6H5G5Z9_9HEMI|nr:unnamed protein product [Nesidiocoris tenuis]